MRVSPEKPKKSRKKTTPKPLSPPSVKKPKVALKPRKKRNKDNRSWHPSQERKSRPRDPNSHQTENLIKFMDADLSPAKRAIFANSTDTQVEFENNQLHTPTKTHTTTLLTPTKFSYSTPEKGPRSRYAFTPTKGSKFLPSRLIECDDGAMALFLPEDKVGNEELSIPVKPKAWIKKSPIPQADMGGMIDIKITKERIKKVEALSRKRKRDGENPRKISQNKVMGDIGATQAMRKSGIAAPENSGQYAHFIAYNFIGDDGQCVKNLGIGTRFANAAMELVNPAIKRLLYQKKNALPAVYVSAFPEWVPGYENIRLLKSLTLIIKDAPGDAFKRSAKIKFNMLSLSRVCLTDVLPVRKFIMAKFSGKEVTASPKSVNTTPMKPDISPKTKSSKNSVAPKSVNNAPLTPDMSDKTKSSNSPAILLSPPASPSLLKKRSLRSNDSIIKKINFEPVDKENLKSAQNLLPAFKAHCKTSTESPYTPVSSTKAKKPLTPTRLKL